MVVFYNILGIIFIFGAFLMDDERKFFALILGNMFIIAAVLYAKLQKIEDRLK